jgi:hypothetical protein
MPAVIRVETPDALTAFILSRMLDAPRATISSLTESRWVLDVPLADRGTIPQVLTVVREWLRQEELDVARVRVDGDDQVIRREAPVARLPARRRDAVATYEPSPAA